MNGTRRPNAVDFLRRIWIGIHHAEVRVPAIEIDEIPSEAALRHPRAGGHDVLRGDTILRVRNIAVVRSVHVEPGFERPRSHAGVGDSEIGAVPDREIRLSRRCDFRCVAACQDLDICRGSDRRHRPLDTMFRSAPERVEPDLGLEKRQRGEQRVSRLLIRRVADEIDLHVFAIALVGGEEEQPVAERWDRRACRRTD